MTQKPNRQQRAKTEVLIRSGRGKKILYGRRPGDPYETGSGGHRNLIRAAMANSPGLRSASKSPPDPKRCRHRMASFLDSTMLTAFSHEYSGNEPGVTATGRLQRAFR